MSQEPISTEGRVSWSQAAAIGGVAISVAAAVGIAMLDKAALIDLSTFTQVLGYLGGLFGAAGGGAFLVTRRKS